MFQLSGMLPGRRFILRDASGNASICDAFGFFFFFFFSSPFELIFFVNFCSKRSMLIFLLRKGVEETKDKVVVGKTKVEEVVLAQIACQCRILIFV